MVVPTRILSLFSGLGGLDDFGVALALPGARVVCAVERCAYCAAALAQRMEQGHLPEAPIWDDVRTFDGTAWRGAVDIVTAGYPCQGFSVAGKRGGEGDPRYLWPEVARVVGECRPAFVFVENVARHLSHGFERVAGELQGMGYEVAALVCRASAVEAPHQRERLFALAVSDAGGERLRELAEWNQEWAAQWGHAELDDLGREVVSGSCAYYHDGGFDVAYGNRSGGKAGCGRVPETRRFTESGGSCSYVAYGDGDGPQGEWAEVLAGEQGSPGDQLDGCCGEASLWPPGPHDAERWAGVDPGLWPSVESPVRGVADGLPEGLGFRRQQLHALGNAVVPVQAAYAFVALANALTRSC